MLYPLPQTSVINVILAPVRIPEFEQKVAETVKSTGCPWFDLNRLIFGTGNDWRNFLDGFHNLRASSAALPYGLNKGMFSGAVDGVV